MLYINWNPDLFAIHIGAFGIRWYSLCWLIGLLGAYLAMKRLYRQQNLGDEKFEPLFLYCFVGILIGARLGHCLFYQPDYFLTSGRGVIEMLIPVRLAPEGNALANLFTFNWHFVGYEGLASHGGTIGLTLALLLYCRNMKMKVWTVLDNIAIVTGITACFIRLGNLMNSEIIGNPTDLPWAFIFERIDPIPRHPGQLYEAIFYGFLAIMMWGLYSRSSKRVQEVREVQGVQECSETTNTPRVGTGFYFGLCIFAIFLFRFFIEWTKEVQEAFEQGMIFNMGQILSIPFIIAGAYCMIKSRKK